MPAAPAHDRGVVGDRLDGLVGPPHRPRARFDPAAEVDVVADFRTRELPGIAKRKPLLRVLVLPAVADDLAKQAVIVADAVAVRGNAERRHAFHETGGEPAEAAVAERSVGFGGAQAVEIDAEVAERGAKYLAEAEIAEYVGKQPADQKFERQIVDALAPLGVARPLGGQPAMNGAVAQRERGGHEPVASGGRADVLADRERELGEHGTLDFGKLALARHGIR